MSEETDWRVRMANDRTNGIGTTTEPNTELSYELNTQQCAEVALHMYAEWEKAMQPPLLIWKSYPDWLRQLKAFKE